jgi:hypothetical protein
MCERGCGGCRRGEEERKRGRERGTGTKFFYTKHLIDIEAREREKGGRLERESE